MKRLNLVSALLFVGCMQTGHSSTHERTQPFEAPIFDGEWDVAKIEDLNPDPNILEVNLTAKEASIEYIQGKPQKSWTYNGTVPGPLLEAKQGDLVIVHFKNELPASTSIHWHGLRVPAEMDGTALMQDPVATASSFTYSFRVSDPGMYWYHPHVRSDEQVEKGLYGPIIVRHADEPAVDAERVLVLDDIMVDPNGNLTAGYTSDFAMVGREGNLAIVNGKANPLLTLKTHERTRIRVVNAANSRYFRLSLAGIEFTWLGSDGGYFPAPQSVSEILLVPGERADFVVEGGTPSQSDQYLESLPYERGHGMVDVNPMKIATVRTIPGERTSSPPKFEWSWAVSDIPASSGSAKLVLDEKMSGSMDDGGHGGHSMEMPMEPVFSINGEVFPNVTPLQASLGSTETWTVTNNTEMDHPFHIHGFFFRATGGLLQDVWKDTINIPANQSVPLGVRFEGYPGSWMFHCHILEHAERGMVGVVEVE